MALQRERASALRRKPAAEPREGVLVKRRPWPAFVATPGGMMSENSKNEKHSIANLKAEAKILVC